MTQRQQRSPVVADRPDSVAELIEQFAGAAAHPS
jgi:hypothetical protein